MRAADGARAGAVSLFRRYAGIVLDVDGVVLHLDQPVPHAAAALATLRAEGVAIAFLTNNATRTPEAVAGALRAAGVDAEPSEVVTSPVTAAALLDPGTRCLVIGMDGLRTALTERGCVLVRDPSEAEAVVVGWDRDLVWDDLRRASLAIARGARFVGTNGDASYVTDEGPWPGNGATLAALTTATGRTPEIVGKPAPALFREAAERLGVAPLLMVGDRPDTDLAGASALGWDTALVLTGVTGAEAAGAVAPRPTWVLDDLRGLLERGVPSERPAGPLVRTMTDADVHAAIALWRDAGFLAYTPEPQRDLALSRANAPELVLVAEDGGEVVGTLLATFDGRRGWLQRLVVAPGHRRQGLGRLLVAEAERRLAARGAPKVNLLVAETNEGGAAFWDRAGYARREAYTFRDKRL